VLCGAVSGSPGRVVVSGIDARKRGLRGRVRGLLLQ